LYGIVGHLAFNGIGHLEMKSDNAVTIGKSIAATAAGGATITGVVGVLGGLVAACGDRNEKLIVLRGTAVVAATAVAALPLTAAAVGVIKAQGHDVDILGVWQAASQISTAAGAAAGAVWGVREVLKPKPTPFN
jgi:hypothetical protein